MCSAWLFERKKRHQEIQSTNDIHQQHIVDMYQEALTDLKNRYDSKFLELEKEIQLLRENLDLWKGKYRTLKKEFDDYRKQHEAKN